MVLQEAVRCNSDENSVSRSNRYVEPQTNRNKGDAEVNRAFGKAIRYGLVVYTIIVMAKKQSDSRTPSDIFAPGRL
jgi:hypothetical protein